jgi:hypothetical protein
MFQRCLKRLRGGVVLTKINAVSDRTIDSMDDLNPLHIQENHRLKMEVVSGRVSTHLYRQVQMESHFDSFTIVAAMPGSSRNPSLRLSRDAA